MTRSDFGSVPAPLLTRRQADPVPGAGIARVTVPEDP